MHVCCLKNEPDILWTPTSYQYSTSFYIITAFFVFTAIFQQLHQNVSFYVNQILALVMMCREYTPCVYTFLQSKNILPNFDYNEQNTMGQKHILRCGLHTMQVVNSSLTCKNVKMLMLPIYSYINYSQWMKSLEVRELWQGDK